MKDLNKVLLIGNLTRDPEVRLTPSGQPVASFTVATNRRWKDRQTDDWKDAVEFNDIVAWGRWAEWAERSIKKGKRVYVEGRLQTRSWEGQDGVKRNKTEIIATDLGLQEKFDGGAEGSVQESKPEEAEAKEEDKGSQPAADRPEGEKKDKEEIDIDDIPF